VGVSVFLGLKYLKPKRSVASIITCVSVIGVMLGVAAVLWQILPTLISVYLTRLSFSVSASVARMLDMKDEEGVLAECAAIAGFLLAVVSAAAILYILMLTYSLLSYLCQYYSKLLIFF
jgi:hypothetical protein